ncbi:hypothetical protein [Mycolicibacter sinensis]|uniref:hypothetical protein n=1 Tax=Mycolicibacter sinensis (strain JDM601) TaxID=875328 RepID=UPI000ADAB934|nr:hypothetical protein [Mycolicibacter sinensis]
MGRRYTVLTPGKITRLDEPTLAAELASADRVDLLCAFAKWQSCGCWLDRPAGPS